MSDKLQFVAASLTTPAESRQTEVCRTSELRTLKNSKGHHPCFGWWPVR